MVKKIFGEVLRQLREENKISQETLADKAELDRTYISQLERGLKQPTLSTLIGLAKVFNIPASKLIERVESEILKQENKGG